MHDSAVSATVDLDEPATRGGAAPVEHGEEHAADDGADEGHLGEAGERDHLAVDRERHAGGVDAAATAVVTAAATTPTTTVVRRSEPAETAEAVTWWRWSVLVTVIAVLLRSAAPDAPLTPSTNARHPDRPPARKSHCRPVPASIDGVVHASNEWSSAFVEEKGAASGRMPRATSVERGQAGRSSEAPSPTSPMTASTIMEAP